MAKLNCLECGTEFNVVPARLKTAKYCSVKCRSLHIGRQTRGEMNPNWRGGREKSCEACGKSFWVRPAVDGQKFCSKPCADKFGFRFSGSAHPNYREDARRKNRGGQHHKWVNAVISRDNAKCRHCGATNVELHAHHIKSYKDHPELRFDVENGIALCYSCHWAVHTAQNENSVNSVEALPVKGVAGGNTEPSLGRKVFEGVTTRGRACRRVVGECAWCKKPVSRRLSDAKHNARMFCNHSCSSKFYQQHGVIGKKPKAVTSSTSAGRESEDIV